MYPLLLQQLLVTIMANLETATEIASLITTGGVGVATVYLTAIGGKLKKNIGDTQSLKRTVGDIKTNVATLTAENKQQHQEIGRVLDDLQRITKPLKTQLTVHNAIDSALEYSYEYAENDVQHKGILLAAAEFYLRLGSYLLDNQFKLECKEVIHHQDINLFVFQKTLKSALPNTWDIAYEKFTGLALQHVKQMMKLMKDPLNAKEQRLAGLLHVQAQEQMTMLNILLKIKNYGKDDLG